MNTGLPIDDVIEAVTGKRPEPIELKDPLLRQMREEMGRARRENQITDEKAWLEQLARFREPSTEELDSVVLEAKKPESAKV